MANLSSFARRRERNAAAAGLLVLTAIGAGPHAGDVLMMPDITRAAIFAMPGFIAAAFRSGLPRTDSQIGAYAGPAYTLPANVHLHQPGGTDLTLRQVPWRGQPFKPPPYYGYRGIWWLPAAGAFGLMLDFTHIKAKSVKEQHVEQAGRRKGAPLPPRGRVEATFDRLPMATTCSP